MVKNFFSTPPPAGTTSFGLDRVKLRLAVFTVLVIAAFMALFSRLWFLQVLESDQFRQAAKENRVRLVFSEPERGRILDRNLRVLVGNRLSRAITVDRQIIDEPGEQRKIVRRLSKLLVESAGPKDLEETRLELHQRLKTKDGKKFKRPSEETVRAKLLRDTRADLKTRLADITVSPFKPVAVAYDVTENTGNRIRDNAEDWPGVAIETLPVREYPQGKIAAHILGYVGEINGDELKSDFFTGREAGDIVGKSGVERTYDHYLRGRPRVERVVVNSADEVIDSETRQNGRPGDDLILSVDARIQKITENALQAGIEAARGASYLAPNGAAVVMDPKTGGIVSMASYPGYDPRILADGFSLKDQAKLQGHTPHNPDDDAQLNRATQAAVPPGSTFKVVTAGAAIANGVSSPYESIDCDPSLEYRQEEFNNWTTADLGFMSLERSLVVSCDTYYYTLGARMEDRWGTVFGDGSERFQKYMRLAGFGHTTGIDLPYETSGRVPDEEWCLYIRRETDGAICADGWLPGYTVNMSIGQGDLIVSPLQMAVTFAAVANGGEVLEPRVASKVGRPDPNAEDGERVIKDIESKVAADLPLDDVTFAEMRAGLEGVVSSGEGTAASAFTGFPLDQYPVAGKTGTAQIGSVDSGKNFAWFVSYAPADDPRYVVAVYIDRAGHGGESAAPVARQIFEGIFKIDKSTSVRLGSDESG